MSPFFLCCKTKAVLGKPEKTKELSFNVFWQKNVSQKMNTHFFKRPFFCYELETDLNNANEKN